MSVVFPKLYYTLPTKTYGGALTFLKGINPLLAKYQKREKGISKPDEHALKNTDDLYSLIGRPLDYIPTIHVAGTNGKGSTSFKISEGLKYSGLRTGLCTGPHISSFRERMQVNGELVTEMEVVDLLETVINLCVENEIPATFFEIAFIMTCLHFRRSDCDVVVVEVGMGGRFDASNVISSRLSIVTSIGMDHMNSLGGTLESIAFHKAGIFKPNTPALVGPGCPMHIMETEAADKNTQLYSLYDYLRDAISDDLLPPLQSHPVLHIPNVDAVDCKSEDISDPDLLCSQLTVAALCLLRNYPSVGECVKLDENSALANIRHIDSQFLDNVHSACLPCRFEELNIIKELKADKIAGEYNALGNPSHSENSTGRVSVKVILDVAHNIPALSALMLKLKLKYDSNFRVVMGMSRGKGTEECLNIIKQYVSHDKIDFIQSDNHRAIAPEELYEMIGKGSGVKNMGDILHGGDPRSGNVFNMVNGEIAPSRYNGTHYTLHRVLNEVICEDMSITAAKSHIKDMYISHDCCHASASDPQHMNTRVCRQVVVVCGTLYAMPHVRRALGIVEPNDAFDVDITI